MFTDPRLNSGAFAEATEKGFLADGEQSVSLAHLKAMSQEPTEFNCVWANPLCRIPNLLPFNHCPTPHIYLNHLFALTLQPNNKTHAQQ
jgi:hypothetical protein